MRHIRIVDPVVKCIHVLDGGMLAAKLPVARFAFVVVVHVGLSASCRKVEVQSDKEWSIDGSPNSECQPAG
jgi:hypothetical protein